MKSYELKPTHENLIETFLTDAIGRNNDIYLFTDILSSIRDNCSIALDSGWGSGKTFFVRQVKLFLDAHNKYIKSLNDEDISGIKNQWKSTHKDQEIDLESQISIYYDAWENDNDDDPIFSLIYSILVNYDSDFIFSTEKDALTKALTILEFFTGRDVNKLINGLKSDTPFDSIRKSKNIENEINQFLESILVEKGNRLNIFIDELDRCKPSYAVRLLERIKHYFSNDRITFIFSINAMELQHTIKKHYGNEFDACRYLDRFFDLRISLPPIDMNKFYQSINFDNSRYTYDIVCDAVVNTYNFSLRETAKYIRLTKIAAHNPTHDSKKYDFTFSDERGVHFCLLYIVPIAIGLKVSNTQRYEDFVSGKDYYPLVEIASYLKFKSIDDLLEKNESYDREDENRDMVIVTLDEKLKAVYDALFVTNYSGNNYQTKVGKYTFDNNTKKRIIRTISLLSNYTNMGVE